MQNRRATAGQQGMVRGKVASEICQTVWLRWLLAGGVPELLCAIHEESDKLVGIKRVMELNTLGVLDGSYRMRQDKNE